MRVAMAVMAAGVALSLSGCKDMMSATRAADRANQKYAEGDYRTALALYEKALDGTPETADLHYKLALLHDDKLKDPVGALHHFQRYLALRPDGPHAKDAKRFVKAGELKLVTSLSRGGLMTQNETARLKNENLKLQREVVTLRDKLKAESAALAQARKASGAPTPKQAAQSQKPVPPGSRTYVVQKGDTLASIARKFYKNTGKWKDLQDANFYQLEGTAKLKPGMTLIIP